MANPQPQDVLGRITLVTGPEEFLGERAISAVRTAVRRHDAEAEFSETMAASLTTTLSHLRVQHGSGATWTSSS